MRSILRSGLVAVCLGVVTGWPASAANWPRFRGPNGVGIALDKNVPVEWKDKDILWKVAIPGIGNSSPVIWGDRLFLQSSSADGMERTLRCLNVADGKTRWSKSLPAATARTHVKNTLASSSPATDGERVYALFWDGAEVTLYAFEFEGKEVWKRPLGNFSSQHGAGASPIVYKDKVILANDQDGSAMVYAFDAKSGKDVWKAERKAFKACYSAPFLIEGPGQPTQLIACSTAGISSYNPDTGVEIWNWTWSFTTAEPLRTVGSPIFSQGLVFATSGAGNGDRHMIAVKADGKGDVTKTNLAWENKRSFPYVPTMLAWGDHLYFVTDRGIAGCYVAKTGDRVWDERLAGNVTASPVLVDGKVYAISEEGEVFVFAAATEFKLLGKNSVGERVMASPAVADGRLFIRGRQHLFCIGQPTGK